MKDSDSRQFNIYTKKLYKIWFSNDPVKFLNEFNQSRLITFREKHTHDSHIISFIYSSRFLNKKAESELVEFCACYNIVPVDFDKCILASGDDRDRDIHQLVSDELNAWHKHEGGNPAAASDVLRRSREVITNYGIYSDFDVELNMMEVDENVLIYHPFLFSKCNNGLNNDFIAIATKECGTVIDSEAEKHIKSFQECIIQRCKDVSCTLNQPFVMLQDDKRSKYELNYINALEHFKKIEKTDLSIHSFRRYIRNLKEEGGIDYEVYDTLYMASVFLISGPAAINFFVYYENANREISTRQQYSDLLLDICSRTTKCTPYFSKAYNGNSSDISWTKEGFDKL